MNSEF